MVSPGDQADQENVVTLDFPDHQERMELEVRVPQALEERQDPQVLMQEEHHSEDP